MFSKKVVSSITQILSVWLKFLPELRLIKAFIIGDSRDVIPLLSFVQ